MNDRCDSKIHRSMGHEDAQWRYDPVIQAWRRLCADCGLLTGVSIWKNHSTNNTFEVEEFTVDAS